MKKFLIILSLSLAWALPAHAYTPLIQCNGSNYLQSTANPQAYACGTPAGGGTGTVTSSGSPVSGNVAAFTSSTNIAPATSANIISLFSTCSGTQYLGADGACHTASGSGTVTNVATGNGLSGGPITTTGTINLSTPDVTKSANYTLAAGDMAGQVNYNGSSLTATIPAISGTIFANGMTSFITNSNASVLTLSSTPTINNYAGTTIGQYGWLGLTSNGTSLDGYGFPGFGTITSNAIEKFSGTSGIATASSVVDNGTIVSTLETVAIGTTAQTAGTSLDLGSETNSILLPVGTTGQRPATGVNGMLRYNSTATPQVEAYVNNAWTALSGSGASGVSSLTGDSVLYNNSASTGAVTLSPISITAKSLVGNATGSSAAFAIVTSPVVSGSMTAATHIPTSSSAPTDGLYLPASNTSGIADNSQPVIETVGTASAVDYMTFTNAATANPATNTIASAGTDTNINLALTSKGTGAVNVTVADPGIQLNGANAIRFPSVDSTSAGTIAIGSSALANIGTSSAAFADVALGYQAMIGTMTTGAKNNTAVGYQAGKAITSASDITAVGYQALVAQTSGSPDTAIGYEALKACSSGCTSDTAVGDSALLTVSNQPNETCVGSQCGKNLTGNDNTGLGTLALCSTTSGTNNVGVGYDSLGNCGTGNSGSQNTVVGAGSLGGTGGATSNNTSLGYNTLNAVTTGASNLALGASVGSTTLTTGSNNILIGTNAGVTTIGSSTSNEVNIANLIYGTGIGTSGTSPAGQVMIGTATPISTVELTVAGTINQSTELSCSTGLTTDANGSINGCVASDQSLKKDINPLSYDPTLIERLKPISYVWIDHDKYDNNTHGGFIAQQVQSVDPLAVKSAGKDLLGIDNSALSADIVLDLQAIHKELAVEHGAFPFHKCISWLPLLCAD